MYQSKVDVSVASEDVTVNLTPGSFVTRRALGAATVPNAVTVTIITVLAVTEVLAISNVPPTKTAPTPIRAFDPALTRRPFPAVLRTTFPLLAVIAPRVAVSVVEAVREPVTAVFPVAFPMFVAPVPPVPIEVTPAPDVLMVVVPVMAAPPADTVRPVPAVIVVVEVIDPGAVKAEGMLNVIE